MSTYSAQRLRTPKQDSAPPSGTELEIYAAFVHGAVALGNLIGLFHNLKRRQWRWVAIHAAGFAAHVIATHGHVKASKGSR